MKCFLHIALQVGWLAYSLGSGEDIITYLSLQCVNVKEAIDALSSFNHVNVEELIPALRVVNMQHLTQVLPRGKVS